MPSADPKIILLEAALLRAPFEGFSASMLAGAAADAAIADPALIFPQGVAGLIAFWSQQTDAEMERRLTEANLPALKIRARIRTAVLTRLDILKPHKDALQKAASFLALPSQALLAATLMGQTCDAIWRAAGDTSTDFNWYSKRAVLAAVLGTTLVTWFGDRTEDERATAAFLDARIENVMQFEKGKAGLREKAERLSDFVKKGCAR